MSSISARSHASLLGVSQAAGVAAEHSARLRRERDAAAAAREEAAAAAARQQETADAHHARIHDLQKRCDVPFAFLHTGALAGHYLNYGFARKPVLVTHPDGRDVNGLKQVRVRTTSVRSRP